MRERIPAPEPGIYYDTPFETYTKWDAASNTVLGRLARSAAHAKATLDGLDKDTEAKRLGRPIHCAVFEPEQLEVRYQVSEQCAVLTDKGKGPRCSNAGLWQDDQRGWVCGTHGKGRDDHRLPSTKAVVAKDEMDMFLGIKGGVGRSVPASAIIAPPAVFEVSIVWRDPETGVTCKARLDAYNREYAGGTIGDGKSTEDARRPAMERSILNFGYYRQAALYLGGAREVGLPAEHFAIIAFEKSHPFLSKVYRIRDDLVERGTTECRALLEEYAHCCATDLWPGYSDEVEDIGVPEGYGWRQLDNRIHEITQRSVA